MDHTFTNVVFSNMRNEIEDMRCSTNRLLMCERSTKVRNQMGENCKTVTELLRYKPTPHKLQNAGISVFSLSPLMHAANTNARMHARTHAHTRTHARTYTHTTFQ